MTSIYNVDATSVVVAGALLITPFILSSLKSLLWRKVIDQSTAIFDLENIGEERKGGRIKGTAVVCGGSLAGLWAARVCSDHFEDVLIIEPEEWLPTEDGRSFYMNAEGETLEHVKRPKRTRVMQYVHPHTIQPFFLNALRKLHPDIEEIFKHASARITYPWVFLHLNGNVLPAYFPEHFPNGDYPRALYATRECVENTVRGLFYQPGGRIRWLVGTVTGLQTAKDDPSIIEQVTVRTADGVQAVPASLVIDCTGSTHAGVKWLERLDISHQSSFKDYIDVYGTPGRCYGVRYFVPTEMRKRLPIPGGYDTAGHIYGNFSVPPHGAGGFIATVMNGHQVELAVCTLKAEDEIKADGDEAIPTPNTLVEFAQNLKGNNPVKPWVVEMIKILQENEPVTVAPTLRFPANTWVHFEKIKGLPSNFIATGDAVMCLNPRFGQGITKGCIDSLTLNRLLRTIPESDNPTLPKDFGSRFFKLQAQRIADMWNSTKALDYKLPGAYAVKGESIERISFYDDLTRLLVQLALEGDPQVSYTLWKVRVFMTSGIEFMHPLILLKALWLKIRLMVGISEPMG